MAATTVAGEGSVILHLSEQLLHVGQPQFFLSRSLVLSECAKLPHGDPVALDRVVLSEEGTHVLDEGLCDGGRKIEGLANYHAFVPIRAGAKLGRISAPRVPQRLQTKRGSKSESLTLSGHRSTSAGASWSEWLHL